MSNSDTARSGFKVSAELIYISPLFTPNSKPEAFDGLIGLVADCGFAYSETGWTKKLWSLEEEYKIETERLSSLSIGNALVVLESLLGGEDNFQEHKKDVKGAFTTEWWSLCWAHFAHSSSASWSSDYCLVGNKSSTIWEEGGRKRGRKTFYDLGEVGRQHGNKWLQLLSRSEVAQFATSNFEALRPKFI